MITDSFAFFWPLFPIYFFHPFPFLLRSLSLMQRSLVERVLISACVGQKPSFFFFSLAPNRSLVVFLFCSGRAESCWILHMQSCDKLLTSRTSVSAIENRHFRFRCSSWFFGPQEFSFLSCSFHFSLSCVLLGCTCYAFFWIATRLSCWHVNGLLRRRLSFPAVCLYLVSCLGIHLQRGRLEFRVWNLFFLEYAVSETLTQKERIGAAIEGLMLQIELTRWNLSCY